MPIMVVCNCGKQLRVPDRTAGKRVRCPGCQASVRVPKPAAEAPPPPTVAMAPPSDQPLSVMAQASDLTTTKLSGLQPIPPSRSDTFDSPGETGSPPPLTPPTLVRPKVIISLTASQTVQAIASKAREEVKSPDDGPVFLGELDLDDDGPVFLGELDLDDDGPVFLGELDLDNDGPVFLGELDLDDDLPPPNEPDGGMVQPSLEWEDTEQLEPAPVVNRQPPEALDEGPEASPRPAPAGPGRPDKKAPAKTPKKKRGLLFKLLVVTGVAMFGCCFLSGGVIGGWLYFHSLLEEVAVGKWEVDLEAPQNASLPAANKEFKIEFNEEGHQAKVSILGFEKKGKWRAPRQWDLKKVYVFVDYEASTTGPKSLQAAFKGGYTVSPVDQDHVDLTDLGDETKVMRMRRVKK